MSRLLTLSSDMTAEKKIYSRDFILSLFSPDLKPPDSFVPIEKLFDLHEAEKDGSVIILSLDTLFYPFSSISRICPTRNELRILLIDLSVLLAAESN